MEVNFKHVSLVSVVKILIPLFVSVKMCSGCRRCHKWHEIRGKHCSSGIPRKSGTGMYLKGVLLHIQKLKEIVATFHQRGKVS